MVVQWGTLSPYSKEVGARGGRGGLVVGGCSVPLSSVQEVTEWVNTD